MNHFKEAAKTWDKDATVNRNKVFADSIEKHLTRDQLSLLDFGCGTGLLSQFLEKKISHLVGIDPTHEMLEQFNSKFTHLKSVKSHALNIEKEAIPSDLGQFDVIVSAMAFHHLENPLKTLGLLKGLLNENGQIFVLDLDLEDGTFHPDNKGMGVHHHGFSEADQSMWSSELGFKSFTREIIHHISKNDREYGVALSLYQI